MHFITSINNFRLEYKKVLILLSFFSFSCISIYNLSQLDKQKELEIIFLDIGQGDSALIKTQSGQKILIDTGSNYITAQKAENNLQTISQVLDVVLLTHPDLDHVGGTQDVIDNFNPKKLIISTENKYEDYKNIEVSQIHNVNSKNFIEIDCGIKNNSCLKLEILSPEKDTQGDDNHKSLVNRLIYGNFEFVFMGDADQEVERKLVSQGYFDNISNIKTKKVLKVGHHGSDTSSSEIFLKKLKPEYCIISAGKDNKYKHPNPEALNRLEKYCKNIYRTDKDRSIAFATNGKDLKINISK